MSSLVKIRNLSAGVTDETGTKTILKGIDLEIKPGEVHAIMGPNGSGKSTLARVLVGHPAFEVLEGTIEFDGQNLLEMAPEERARAGVFMGFQYPVEVPGVNNASFLRMAYNAKMRAQGKDELDPIEFEDLLEEKSKLVEMDPKLLSQRAVNEGFSGGEKKRNEILQLAVLDPKLSILDEIDSGLDIDALRIVANGVNELRSKENAFVLVTHYQRLLDYIVPDVVHVLADGRIIKTGGKELALELEEKGYDWLVKGLKAEPEMALTAATVNSAPSEEHAV